MCKNCVKELVDVDNMLSVHKVLIMLDKPFLNEIWEVSVKDNNETFGTYIKNISMPQYRSMTYKDGEVLGNGKNISSISTVEDKKDITPQQLREYKMFWGNGFSIDDYEYLETQYTQWTTRHKSDEFSEQELFKEISLLQLEIRKDRENKSDVTKKVDQLQKLMGSANVKPVDQGAINSADNMNACGVWIRDIERYKPAEYFKDKQLYEDFDKFKEYLDRFMLRPLKNLLTGSREFDKEFNIEEDKYE